MRALARRPRPAHAGAMDGEARSGPERLLRIGEAAEATGLSVDTLRYYERLGLLGEVPRTPGGARLYGERQLSRLRFIRRAQRMRFTLEEIGALLAMRDDPQGAREAVRALTAEKLAEVEAALADLRTLRDELTLLLNLCRGAAGGECPILERLDEGGEGKVGSEAKKGGER